MPTQVEIAEHLGMNQSEVSRHMASLGIDWQAAPLDDIRLAYIAHLRAVAAGHRTEDGLDLVRERVYTEQVDRELKLFTLAEKKGALVNVAQLEPELMQMVAAFRTDMLALPDILKSEIDALYDIDLDAAVIEGPVCDALAQLARYDPGHSRAHSAPGGSRRPARADDDHGMEPDP